jgi:hypothetical protein
VSAIKKRTLELIWRIAFAKAIPSIAQTAAMLLDDYDRALTLLSVATAHLKAKNRAAAR